MLLKIIRPLVYELIKTSHLAISPQLFHSKLKIGPYKSFNKSYPDSSSFPTSLPVLTPNTVHLSRLTVCLPDWLSGSDPLPVDFALDTRL